MTPPTSTDPGRQGPCLESYAALYAACRNRYVLQWDEREQLSEFARLVSDFALCARAARLRPEVVLVDLRAALAPIPVRTRVSMPDLIEQAIRDYYGAQPQ